MKRQRILFTVKRVFFYPIFAAILLVGGLGSTGCSKKTTPSELHIGFDGRQKTNRSDQRRREKIARSEKKKTRQLERKANAKREKAKKEGEKARAKMAKRHLEKQHPDAQKRMKENQKETEKRNRKSKTLMQRLMFWK